MRVDPGSTSSLAPESYPQSFQLHTLYYSYPHSLELSLKINRMGHSFNSSVMRAPYWCLTFGASSLLHCHATLTDGKWVTVLAAVPVSADVFSMVLLLPFTGVVVRRTYPVPRNSELIAVYTALISTLVTVR